MIVASLAQIVFLSGHDHGRCLATGRANHNGAMLIIEPALPGDAERVARVHTRSWQHAYRGIFSDEYLDSLDWRERLPLWEGVIAAARPDQVLVVARSGDAVIGFASAGPARDEDLPSGAQEIYAIYLDPGFWSHGIGSRLLQAVLGQRETYLWVLEDNHRARRFYQAHGFRPDGTRLTYERCGVSAPELRYRR
jgi:ribosomal protein S18 acetylase RimI-like enzyme